MIDENFMVRPVVHPMTDGESTVSVDVWIPPFAAGWVVWNTSTLLKPTNVSQTITIDATIADLPIFVRGGSVLPLLPTNTRDVT